MRTKSKKKEHLISLRIIKFYMIFLLSTLIINSAYSLENKILFKESYDEFCKAGKDWDAKFSSLGAKRIHDIQLCSSRGEP